MSVQFLLSATCLIVAVSAIDTQAPERRPESAAVRYVVDGDTIDIAGVGRVRLLGVDAPEFGRGLDTPEPFAAEARDFLSGALAGRWVRLEYEPSTSRDRYRRRLAYVFLGDGTFVNALMVRAGLARVSARRQLVRLSELRRAEADAKMSRRGMWGVRPSLPSERYVVPKKRPPGK